jgi:hypothetical protein
LPVVVKVVNAPVLAVPDPIVPGLAHGISAEAMAPTLTAPPAVDCFKYCPVPPLAERSAPEPPRARAREPVLILLASRLGISEALRALQAGAVAADPVPLLVKNCFVAVVFPAKRASVPAGLAIRMSPTVVRGDRASKAAEAVVAPVPPLAIATVPVTFVAFPFRVAETVPPLTALPETFPAVMMVASLVSAIFALAAISLSTMVVDPAVIRPLMSTVTFA